MKSETVLKWFTFILHANLSSTFLLKQNESAIFVASVEDSAVEDSATMSSILYFEKSCVVCKIEGSRPY